MERTYKKNNMELFILNLIGFTMCRKFDENVMRYD